MNVADAQVFNRVATTRSFSEAAQQLGVTRSAVSKSVSRLEEGLGVVLLNRSPRKASLTEAGRIFYQHSAQIDADLERAYASVSGGDQRPVGKVSCSLPSCLGAALLPALLQRFRVAWPELTLNLNFDDRFVDLVGRVARSLEQRHGMTHEGHCVRRRSDAGKRPSGLRDLSDHRCAGELLDNCVEFGSGAGQALIGRGVYGAPQPLSEGPRAGFAEVVLADLDRLGAERLEFVVTPAITQEPREHGQRL